MRLRINAKDKDATNAQDDAVAKAYGNKFIIPLNFEIFDSAMPYYQAGLGSRLCYEIIIISMIMENLLMQKDKHQPQMLSMRAKI